MASLRSRISLLRPAEGGYGIESKAIGYQSGVDGIYGCLCHIIASSSYIRLTCSGCSGEENEAVCVRFGFCIFSHDSWVFRVVKICIMKLLFQKDPCNTRTEIFFGSVMVEFKNSQTISFCAHGKAKPGVVRSSGHPEAARTVASRGSGYLGAAQTIGSRGSGHPEEAQTAVGGHSGPPENQKTRVLSVAGEGCELRSVLSLPRGHGARSSVGRYGLIA